MIIRPMTNLQDYANLFSFIYNYISTELDDCLKPYEIEYFKKYAFAQITGMPIEEDIQYPISEIYRMSKTDLGAFIHNLYIMCHYCRTDLKENRFLQWVPEVHISFFLHCQCIIQEQDKIGNQFPY